MSSSGSAFDDLLAEITGTGWYQKRLVYFLLAPIFFVVPFTFLHQIFVYNQNDHWCTPPEHLAPSNFPNMSMAEWKQTFMPMELGANWQFGPSQCKMYNVEKANVTEFLERSRTMGPNVSLFYNTKTCREMNGWTYDYSVMSETAATENDWVCDLATRPTDLFTFGTVGLIVGTAIFSYLADAKGRRLAFYLATVAVIVFQLAQIGVSHNYGAFLALKILSYACMLPLFQTPMAISTEISSPEGRAFIIGISCIAWSIGNITLPLVAWLMNSLSWKWLKVVCTVPVAFVFFTYKIVPESPRWLLAVGKIEAAKDILIKMANVNSAKVPEDLDEKLRSSCEKGGDTDSYAIICGMKIPYSYIALFKTWRMAWRTICVTIAFTASAFVYYQLVINLSNLDGNIYLNMFLMGLVEGPGCLAAVWFSNKCGRRWSHFTLLGMNAILFFALMWVSVSTYSNKGTWMVVLCMWVKFNISGTFVVSYLQAIELFPTSVRQSGIGFATLISQTISIGGPYVIFLGQTDARLPYAVMFLVCAAGAAAVAFLPETLGAKLPETLEEASVFGIHDKFFSYLPSRDNEKETADSWFEKEEKESLMDWNVLMKDVVDGKPDDLNAQLVKDLLTKHYAELKQSNV